jgi:hypothetical protein
MGFYNVQKGQASFFKWLADTYTMSDNFHQSVMGGTGVQRTMLGTGDSIFWEQSGNFPAQPPASQVANPNPTSSTNDKYVADRHWTNCSDETQPGIKPILDYLRSLPWRPDRSLANCQPGRFFAIKTRGLTHNGRRTNAGFGQCNQRAVEKYFATIHGFTGSVSSNKQCSGNSVTHSHEVYTFAVG